MIDDTNDIINLLEKKNIVSANGIVYQEFPAGVHDYNSCSLVFPEFLLRAFASDGR